MCTASALTKGSVDLNSVLISAIDCDMNNDASRFCARIPLTKSCKLEIVVRITS